LETVTEESQQVVKLLDENTGAWKFVRKDKGPTKSIGLVESMLQRLGLSKNEIRVYVYLARSRERKASEISEALSLHRTETYRILRDLEKKGLVASVFEKPLKFIATPFARAVEALLEAKKLRIRRLEMEKHDLIKIWQSLPQPEVKKKRKEVFQILEGEEQIDFKASEIIQQARGDICVFASEEDLARLYHSGFVDQLEKLVQKSSKCKFLTDGSPKSSFFAERMDLPSIKSTRSDTEPLPTFILADQEQLLLIIRKNGESDREKAKRATLSALWTNYSAFVSALDRLFAELWNAKRPLKAVSTP
jgi:sugar-specific transcriptional regulator TrmB